MQSKMYRPELDGLRAVAILAVVLYHAHVPGFRGGFVGVDIFFVLSGYLVTLLLYQEVTSTGTIALKRFFERRIRRLVPALVVVICVTLLLGSIFLTPIGGEQQGLARSALAAIAMSSNVHFFQSTGGYFDGPTELQPLLHTWSLSVEAQFYLVWPLFILGISRLATAQKQSLKKWLSVTLTGLLGLSFVGSVWLTYTQPQAAFFLMPFRAWEFAVGALIVFLSQSVSMKRSLSHFIAAVGMGGILFSVIAFDDTANFPGYLALLPVFSTSALILASCSNAGIGRWLSNKSVVMLGGLSYSWYLWHWPLLSIARIHTFNELSIGAALVICTVSLGLAGLTYRFIEDPIRKKRFRLMATSSRAFKMAGVMAFTATCLSVSLGAWAKYLWPRYGENAAIQNAIASMQKVKLPECAQLSPYQGSLIESPTCTLPTSLETPNFLVWGDSHSAHLVPMATTFSQEESLTMRIRYMPECPPLSGFRPEHLSRQKADDCVQYNQDVLEEISHQAHSNLSGVVLSARWSAYARTNDALEQFESALEQTLTSIEQLSLKVVLVAPVPELPFDAPACLARKPLQYCGVAQSTAEDARKAVMDVFSVVSREFDQVRVVDPLDAICKENYCLPQQAQVVLYSDSHHLSKGGSLAILPSFQQDLSWVVKKTNILR